MRKAQIKRSWIVYPPDYCWKSGDKYYYVPFLKDAWNKACSLGIGAECCERIEQVYGDGSASWRGGKLYVVGESK